MESVTCKMCSVECGVSSHVTKFHACHAICTLSPRHAAPSLQFAEHTRHDTSKAVRLPREITTEVSKVLRCHENSNSTSENNAKVVRLQHKTSFDTF